MTFKKISGVVGSLPEAPETLEVVFVDSSGITHYVRAISIDFDSDCYPQIIRLLENGTECDCK